MKKRKNMVIVCLLLAVLCLSIAYAAFATTLTINGNANISSDEWNVEITDIHVKTKTGNADGGTPTHTKTTATFDAKLITPGDSVTYEVTITNKGSITANFSSQSWVEEVGKNAPITYTLPNDSVFTTPLAQNQTVTFEVVATYDADADGTTKPDTSKKITGTINYQQ